MTPMLARLRPAGPIILSALAVVAVIMLLVARLGPSESPVDVNLERLAREDFAAIEAALAEVRAGIGPGGAGDIRLMRELSVFHSTDPDLHGRLQRWLAWKPDSAFVQLALGLRLRHIGRAYRGARVVSRTAPEALALFKEKASEAAIHFRAAAALDPGNPLPAIFLADLPGGVAPDEATFAELIEGPARLSETVFDLALYKAHPKWGGSMEEVAWLLAELETRIPENPALARLRGFDDFIIADQLLHNDYHNEALAYSESALRKGENSWYVHTQARALLALKRPEEALAVADDWLARWPEWPFLHEDRIAALADLNRHQEVIAEVDRLLRHDPLDVSMLSLKARHLMRLDRYDEALASIRKAAIYGRYDSRVHLTEAQILHRLGDLPAARTAALEAVRLRPDSTYHFSWLLVIVTAMYDCEESMQTAERFVQLCAEIGDCKADYLDSVTQYMAELPDRPYCRNRLDRTESHSTEATAG